MVYAHDPGRAKRLLADAGYANGFPIDIFAFQLPGFPEGRAMAEAIAGYWQHVGLKPRLIPVDYPAFRKQWFNRTRSEEHTSELQSRLHLVCRLLLEKKKKTRTVYYEL